MITSRLLSSEEQCVGGVSNGVDARGGQSWPKVVQGRGMLQEVLSRNDEEEESSGSEEKLIEDLFSLLAYVLVSMRGGRRS